MVGVVPLVLGPKIMGRESAAVINHAVSHYFDL